MEQVIWVVFLSNQITRQQYVQVSWDFVKHIRIYEYKGKVKVDPVLTVIRNHGMKTYTEAKVHLHAFLTSVLDEGGW
jgi:hypothetical protein